MAVAPDAVRLVEHETDLDGLADLGRRHAGGPAGPDHPQPRRVARPEGVGPAALPRPVDARPQRPLLRHHQPTGRAEGHRRQGRRRGRHRLGQLLQHRRPREGGPRLGLPPGHPGRPRRPSCPTTSPAPSASPPAPRPPRCWSQEVVARLDPVTASSRSPSRPRTSTSPRLPSSASCCGRSPPRLGRAAGRPAGRRPPAADPAADDRVISAADVLGGPGLVSGERSARRRTSSACRRPSESIDPREPTRSPTTGAVASKRSGTGGGPRPPRLRGTVTRTSS